MFSLETCREEQGIPQTQCSKTKGLRSAGEYGLQLVLAAGKYVMERHLTDERAQSLQPGEGQLFFYQVYK